MTIQEALEVLEKEKKCGEIPAESPECDRQHTLCHGCKYEVSEEDITKAREMEIKSLKAWEKVFEDLENELDYYQSQPAPRNANAKYVQQAIISAYTDAIDTVKKHLQGVEE